MPVAETRVAHQHAVIQPFDPVGPKLVPNRLAILDRLDPIAAQLITNLLAAELLTLEGPILRVAHLVAAKAFDHSGLRPHLVPADLLAVEIVRPLSAIDLHHATAVALHALRLEALAAATVTLDALDLEALASATASTLETLGLAAATASLTLDTLRLAATAFAAAAARFRLGLVAAVFAGGLCRRGGSNRQRRNAGRQE